MPERIETERLVLRRPLEADRDAYTEVFADPVVWAAIGTPGQDFDRERVASRYDLRLAHWEEHGFGFYLLEPADSGEVAGFLAVWHPDFLPALSHEVEVGWSLRSPFQGHGYVTEAARAVVPLVFENLAVPRIVHLIAISNEPSQAVAKRLGSKVASRQVIPETGVELDVWELRPAPGSSSAPPAA
jgi:RimJ/RimL family protein N-acetyltransferase